MDVAMCHVSMVSDVPPLPLQQAQRKLLPTWLWSRDLLPLLRWKWNPPLLLALLAAVLRTASMMQTFTAAGNLTFHFSSGKWKIRLIIPNRVVLEVGWSTSTEHWQIFSSQ
jgi:hypothetical protein